MVKSNGGEYTDRELIVKNTKDCFSADAELALEVYDVLESTNIVAAERIKSRCAQWHTVIARAQTNGSGRLGRQFFSPKDTGLYMSIVLYPEGDKADLITGMAAVAVCEALEKEFSLLPKIKWVNDIFIDNKKVAGILAKGVTHGESLGVILGIGINVYPPAGGFPDDIKDTAGYLFYDEEDGVVERLCESILCSLKRRYDTMGGDEAPEEYRKRCITQGKAVTVIPSGCPEKTKNARAVSVSDRYRLLVEYENGEREELSSGEVSVKL